MKRLILLLALCGLLCGCSSVFDGSYHSRTFHEEQGSHIQSTTITASDAESLRTVMEDLVSSGTSSAVINVTDFGPGSVETAMASVSDYIRTSFPLGAWAVDTLDYEIGPSGSMHAISVSITYLHSRAELRRVRTVADTQAAEAAIGQALEECETSLVLLVEQYSQTDFAQLAADFADENPNLVMESPQVLVSCYPERGSSRVVEMFFTYQTSREALRNMQNQVQPVFSAARLYVSGDGSDLQKYSQLYSFLMERFDYTHETSITPAYSLLSHGVGDSKAFATVYAAMCRRSDLECLVITGTRDGEPWSWNMICDNGRYYHVDLLRCAEKGRLTAMTDEEMSGYVWDYSAYPVCGQIPTTEE